MAVTSLRDWPEAPGAGILRADLWATGVLLVVQVAADIAPGTPALAVAVGVSSLLFLAGIVTFLVGFLTGVGRSREEAITLSGLYLLTGTAPDPVRKLLLGTLAAQVVIAVATAAVHPFTPLAFGILAPLFGLGCVGLWSSRHGTFFTREEAKARAEAPDEVTVAGASGPLADTGDPDSPRKRRWWEPVDEP